MKKTFDVDIDVANREEILSHIEYIPAIITHDKKHNSGIYITSIPTNPLTNFASIDYKTAENLGYLKLDLLNQSVYKLIKSPEHLEQLLSKEPNWKLLNDKNFVEKLIHIGSYYELIQKLPEPINSIETLAMFLAIIRPGKKHLQGLPWNIIEKTVWDGDNNNGYIFKKSHSLAYSLCIMVNMNILEEINGECL